MKNFKTPQLIMAVLLMIVFVYSSCSENTKRDDSFYDENILSIEEMRAEAKLNAQKEWEKFKISHPDIIAKAGNNITMAKSEDNGTEAMGGGSDCNCSYIITEVNLINPPGFPKHEINFFSAECEPLCPLFSGLGHSFAPDCIPPTTGVCPTDIWTQPYENEVGSFNCPLPRYSVFPVFLIGGALSETNCTSASDTYLMEVKFKIACVAEYYGHDCIPDSPNPAWTQYISEEMTLTISNDPGGTDDDDLLYVVLGNDREGCGCFPKELAVQ